MRRLLFIVFCFTGICPAVENVADTVVQPQTTPPVDEKPIDVNETLDQLHQTIESTKKDIAKLEKDLLKATDTEKAEKQQSLEDSRSRLKDLTTQFEVTARGAGVTTQQNADSGDASLVAELTGILRPYVADLKEATRQPREIESLNRELDSRSQALKAEFLSTGRLNELIDNEKIPEVRAELVEMRNASLQRQEEIKGQIAGIKLQIAELRKNARPILTVLSANLTDFWKSRGVSLLLALSAGALTYYVGQGLFTLYKRHSPLHRRYANGFSVRLLDLVTMLSVGGAALMVPITVFYVRNDWLLLTLIMLALLGLMMASRTFIMPMLEQLRLYLNIGSVRLGERVIINGLAWRVDQIQFYARLVNPDLDGAIMRVPASQLHALTSRPSLAEEPWFPTRLHDWVILDNNLLGKVVIQTPEQIVLLKIGGARKTFPTPEFLTLNPENLSQKDFLVSTIFGLDYRHQDIALTEIPRILEKEAILAIQEKFGKEDVVSVGVEFVEAAASSLNYSLMVTARGSLASRYNAIPRALQQSALNTANQRGWVIPFPQLTISRTTASEPRPPEQVVKLP